jgi:hypothetical protein
MWYRRWAVEVNANAHVAGAVFPNGNWSDAREQRRIASERNRPEVDDEVSKRQQGQAAESANSQTPTARNPANHLQTAELALGQQSSALFL